MKITDLPFNQLIGITAAEKDDGMLCLPNDVRYTNHLGTVHASALLALAEATSSTVQDLVNGNCLPSADTLFVGQTIYLPRSPISG